MTDKYKAGDKVTFELTGNEAWSLNHSEKCWFTSDEIVAREKAPEPESEVDKFFAAYKDWFTEPDILKEMLKAFKADIMKELGK